MRRHYPAFIMRDDDAFTVIFPDLPGCLTFGPTAEDAFESAIEALEGHLEALHDSGMSIPAPSDIATVSPEPDHREALLTTVLVPTILPGRTVRTNITIEQGLLDLIDAVAPNRSAFFSEAARAELARRRGA